MMKASVSGFPYEPIHGRIAYSAHDYHCDKGAAVRVTIRDSEALRAVRPEDLRACLEAKGWLQKAHLSAYGAVWVQSASGRQSTEALVHSRNRRLSGKE